MAGGGGGSWKVAYADFVTAMMAFFLVMWLGAQDQKIKEAVANYFVDPASGASKKPVTVGAVLDKRTYGSVPAAESVSLGKGRQSNTPPREPSPVTKLVHEWVNEDKDAKDHWKSQADTAREEAARSPEVVKGATSVKKKAAEILAKQMRNEMANKASSQAKGIYRDLLYESIADVNWTEVAEDLLGGN
jgi:chemotaxis protein MotB